MPRRRPQVHSMAGSVRAWNAVTRLTPASGSTAGAMGSERPVSAPPSTAPRRRSCSTLLIALLPLDIPPTFGSVASTMVWSAKDEGRVVGADGQHGVATGMKRVERKALNIRAQRTTLSFWR